MRSSSEAFDVPELDGFVGGGCDHLPHVRAQQDL